MANLCQDTASEAFFEIERQNPTEKLIAGSFQASLCSGVNPDADFVIYDAIYKDIPYILNY